MDHDDTDFQSQNFQLAGEGSKKFPSGLRPFALPKLDIEEQLQGHLRFDNLIDSEVFFSVQEHENSWIEVLSTRSSVVDFSNNAFYAFLNRGPMSEGSGTWLVDSEDLYELYNRMGVVDDEYNDGSASARGDGMFGVRGDGVFYDPLEALGQHKKFMVLSEKDILDREEEHITNISDMFAIKKEEACFLLNHYEWDIRKLFDDWSDDEKRVRDTVGFLNADDLGNDEHLVCGEIRNNEVACGICLQEHSSDMMSSVGCRHLFCHECWEGYLRSEISDGSRCLSLRCPSASCNAMVHQVFVNEFARDEDKEKYARFVLRAYIESTKMTRKWCPAPGCSCAIEFLGGEDYNVSCSCGYGFCWNCTTEVHRPVKCEDVAKWRLKNQDENESENWLCLREFTNHDDYYSCNAYQKDRQQGLHDLDDAEIEKAKESLDRYLHYYMRWDFYEQSRKRAQEDLQNVENHITYLATLYQIPESKLNFMTEVLLQVIDCSIVNKWTYVYGYYLDDDSNIELFEFIQVEAERMLKQLRSTFDMELERMSSGKASKDGVDDIRVKLTTLTSATRECFENFVGALETGLEVHKSLADPVVS